MTWNGFPSLYLHLKAHKALSGSCAQPVHACSRGSPFNQHLLSHRHPNRKICITGHPFSCKQAHKTATMRASQNYLCLLFSSRYCRYTCLGGKIQQAARVSAFQYQYFLPPTRPCWLCSSFFFGINSGISWETVRELASPCAGLGDIYHTTPKKGRGD